MKCKHKLDYEVCLVCYHDAHKRAGVEMSPDVLLRSSEVLQRVIDKEKYET